MKTKRSKNAPSAGARKGSGVGRSVSAKMSILMRKI
jgi:hypothetical protein